MRHTVALALVLIGFGGFLASQVASSVQASGNTAHLLVIDDAITPLEARRFSEAVEEADAAGSHLLVVQLSTPGGLFDSTREIVEEIFASPVPVVVYVGPAGALSGRTGRTCPIRLRRRLLRTRQPLLGASPLSATAMPTPFRIRC